MANKKIKFPRIIVSNPRHDKLRKEARDRDTTMEEIAEEKFVIADKQK